MTRDEFLAFIQTQPRLADGAMGTQLMACGLPGNACGELWNVERPDLVESVHRDYRNAGCDLIITNTFGGNSPALERHGLSERAEELNRAAAAIARGVADGQALVLGDIGPFGGFLEPYGDMTAEALTEIFARQAAALHEGGADAAIVETMADPQELTIALRAALQVADWAVITTYAFDKSGDGTFRTMMGTSVADAIGAAIDAGADMVGANCGTSLDLDDYVLLAEQIVAVAGTTPVLIEPNAGAPQTTEKGVIYPATPQAMAELVPRLLRTGVRALGGCCGTTPGHLRAMKEAING